MLKIKSLHKEFRESGAEPRVLFKGLTVSLEGPSCIALVGPSGCGKSTLLRCLAGLENYEGQIEFLQPYPRFAFVFQEARLLPWLTVEENLRLPLEVQGAISNLTRREVARVLERVRLPESEKFFPDQLSGGMKMRVSLARALIQKPDYLLLDEPLGALDDWTRTLLQAELIGLMRSGQIQRSILVTHSISEAVLLADEIVLLGKSGELKEIVFVSRELGPAIERPSDLRFDSKFNSLSAKISHQLHQIQGSLP